MKTSFSLVVLLVVVAITNPSVIMVQAQCPTLLWSDEFDGTDLDDTKWTPMIGNGCDLGVCGWGNNEWQYYTSNNFEVSDGTLKIHAKYDAQTNDDSKRYTSARLRTLGLADFDLSKGALRLEASIKVPKNSKGLWPAFWMMPSMMEMNTWPLGGEIDIMEFIGREPNNTHGYMHYGLKWNDKGQLGGPLPLPEHVGEQFHEFVLEKTPKTMSWYVDGYRFQTYTEKDIQAKFAWPFEQVFHFVLNLAVGGNWPEYPDSTTIFPATLEVDYVRVYKLKNKELGVPRIEGKTLVRFGQKNVKYCIKVRQWQPNTDFDSFIEWNVPQGASIKAIDDDPTCIFVNFARHSGYVQANMHFTCGRHYTFKVPVEVQDYYKEEFSFLVPDGHEEVASYVSSSGNYQLDDTSDPDGGPFIAYQRKLEEVYDNIILDTGDSIPDPELYVLSAKKFYMDAKSETIAPCTRVFIQLEDSSLATPDNYPLGRHSRYIAFMKKDSNYQRLEFDFYDKPDVDSYHLKVDRMVILVDSFVQRADMYHFRRLISAAAGCDRRSSQCEPLSTNPCRKEAKSEEGACADGFNNDGYGWNGDEPVDCGDADCWTDPACEGGYYPPPPSPVEICNDGIDNDNNGYVDCDDEACATSQECGSWYKPECSAYSLCVEEGHVGDCCPTKLGEYKECCAGVSTPKSCSVNPACAALGLQGDCCPTTDGTILSCCQPELCTANPKCSGLEGNCCPTNDGVFLDCCEDKPETCQIHPKCHDLGLTGLCCPTPDGVFLDCCEPRECALHPACETLADSCCPTQDGVYLDCCNLDMPYFEGFTGIVSQVSKLEAMPEQMMTKSAARSSSLAFGIVAAWVSLFVAVAKVVL